MYRCGGAAGKERQRQEKNKGVKYFNFFIPSTVAAAPFLPLSRSRIPPFP
jgi:hypothetical protein